MSITIRDYSVNLDSARELEKLGYTVTILIRK